MKARRRDRQGHQDIVAGDTITRRSRNDEKKSGYGDQSSRIIEKSVDERVQLYCDERNEDRSARRPKQQVRYGRTQRFLLQHQKHRIDQFDVFDVVVDHVVGDQALYRVSRKRKQGNGNKTETRLERCWSGVHSARKGVEQGYEGEPGGESCDLSGSDSSILASATDKRI